MNTPVQALPTVPPSTTDPKVSALSALSHDHDPSVQDIMKDIEIEVANATAQHQHHQQQQQRPQSIPQHHPLPPYMIQPHVPVHASSWIPQEWLNLHIAQKSLLIAIMVMFIYSGYVTRIYDKVPKLQSVQSYDHYVRAFIIALVLYIAFIKFKI